MRYIKFLHLINFQSHQDTWVELDQGLNIFIGESDQGKTAIIRALRWLIYNEPRGSGFIRVGETRCEVIALLNNDTKITRLRDETKRQNRYIINYADGRELILEKFKNEVPLEVQQELGIYPLWIDTDQKLELNIARQLDSPFLIAESAANRAKIIGRIANLHIIDAAQRDLLRDIRAQGRVKADLEKEIADLEEEKKHYEDLPQKENQIKQIKRSLDTLYNLKIKNMQIEELKKQKDQLTQNINDNDKKLMKLKTLEKTWPIYELCIQAFKNYKELIYLKNKFNEVKPELDKHLHTINKLVNLKIANDKYKHLLDLNILHKKLLTLQANQKAAQGQLLNIENCLTKTIHLPEAEHLINRLYDLRQKGHDLQQLMKTSRQLNLDRATKERETDKIAGKLELLRDINKAEQIIKNQNASLARLKLLEELDWQIKQAEAKIRDKENELHILNNNHREIQQNFIKLLSEAGTCPTCGSTITPLIIEEIAEKTAI